MTIKHNKRNTLHTVHFRNNFEPDMVKDPYANNNIMSQSKFGGT